LAGVVAALAEQGTVVVVVFGEAETGCEGECSGGGTGLAVGGVVAGEAGVVAGLADGVAIVVVLVDAVAELREVVLLPVAGVQIASGTRLDVEAGCAGIDARQADCSAIVVEALDAATGGDGASEVGRGAERAVTWVALAGHALVAAGRADRLVGCAVVAVGTGTVGAVEHSEGRAQAGGAAARTATAAVAAVVAGRANSGGQSIIVVVGGTLAAIVASVEHPVGGGVARSTAGAAVHAGQAAVGALDAHLVTILVVP